LEGFDGVAGVAGLEPPELEEDELEFVLEELVPVELVLAAVFAFGSGRGLKGSWTAPPLCVEEPPVVSATAFSGLVWLIATPEEAAGGALASVVVGVALEPPPITT
jgi:hypothetical protein